ncbi:hypothetical protein [Massilia sp. Bi118]|uniref:hypothetical protein n=1 Tax=Massilia sp. Bi118 TaxID=2822346 RepID=UPI001E59ABD5|nr:hypothetical protein [Massilia sp. Bi118]
MLPDALEKHCIQAERNLDKNAWASKKRASAHLLLWICRRFSTDEMVCRAFELLNLSVCIQISWQTRPAVGDQQVGDQQSVIGDRVSDVGRMPAIVLRRSRRFHFLPEDKKTLEQRWPLSIAFGVCISLLLFASCLVAVGYRRMGAKCPVFHAKSFLCIS